MSESPKSPHPITVPPFSQFVGEWTGVARTWFEPDVLADESPVQGRIESVLNGRFLRHTYTGAMQGRPRHGEETLAVDTVLGQAQVAWMDDFHMSASLLWSEGTLTPDGCSVLGHYQIAPGQTPWGWRTDYELIDADHLVITAYNIMPGAEPARAVETRYTRLGR